jgi:hypothetical protein
MPVHPAVEEEVMLLLRRCVIDRLGTVRVHSIAAVRSLAMVAFELFRVCSQTNVSTPDAAAF